MSSNENLLLIDWNESIALADDDPGLAIDILTLTGRALPNDMEEISAAMKNQDEREMRRLLHKLEGGISYAKFPRLETATLALHQAVKNSESEKFDPLYKALQVAMTDTLQAIQQKIHEYSNS